MALGSLKTQQVDHSDEEDTRPMLGMRKWPISGCGERHPFPAFHDTSGFEEADIFFADSEDGETSEISEWLMYNDKDQMKQKNHYWHIKKNIEIKQTHSDTRRIRYKCKSDWCKWGLVARATGFGNAWAIMKNEVKHTCHADASRLDHAQLMSAMVANCLKMSLEKKC